MAKFRNSLNDRRVKTEKAGRHADGGNGLYLEIKLRDPDQTKPGARKTEGRYWLFRDGSGDKVRWRGLGVYPGVSLKMARAKAERFSKAIYEGKDPFAAPVIVPTFAEATEQYLGVNGKSWRNVKHHAQWRMTLGDAYCASIRKLPVSEIDSKHVLEVLSPVWHSKAETARRLRGRIENILDFARAKGWRSGENPARWRGNLNGALKAVKPNIKHHVALDFEKVPAFLASLRAQESVPASCLEFTILTAARPGEAIRAVWDEVDFEKALWTIPAAKMKAGRQHTVPLSAAALRLLQRLSEARTGDFVFPGLATGRPISHSAVYKLAKPEKITIHGFRSAFRDWAGDHTNFPRETAEAALAHAVGDATERAYRRSDALDKRRQLMDAWAGFIEAGSERGKVMQFPG